MIELRLPSRLLLVVAAWVAAFVLWACPATAQPAERVLSLEVLPDAPEIEPDPLRDRVATELGMRVVAPGSEAADAADGTLTVGVRRDTRELVVEYRRRGGYGLSRRVALPAGRAALQQTVVFLAGNMVRDESQDLLRGLRPPVVEPPDPSRDERPPPPPTPEPERRRFWVGVSVEGALGGVPGTSNACGAATGFYCVTPSGQDYAVSDAVYGATTNPIPGNAPIASGLAFASSRFSVSVDYAVSDNWLVGARLGLAVGRYPGSAAGSQGKVWGPTHLEARATYVLGDRALARPGVRLATTVGAGVSEWDTKTGVALFAGNPPSRLTLDAWRVQAGPFVSAALGPRIALGDRVAIALDAAKVTALAGVVSGTGLTLLFTPELRFELGF